MDFTIRDPEGRRYRASLARFATPPALGSTFIATDFEEFDSVVCEVIAIDYDRGFVYHRPVDPSDVPGTAERPVLDVADDEADAAAVRIEDVRVPQFAP